ncbi:MAG: nucleotide sugar dehydrogenase [Deltaproteobacteria bacterium]|nr:nucleotide sugar dehydrogenase [Deltaproteobacteria bacterium]
MENTIAVIGLGHVGLTLAVTLAEEGFNVIGVEKSPEILHHLQKISPPFFESGLKELLEKHLGKDLHFFDSLPNQSIGTYILCVGTPLKLDLTPNLQAAEMAMQDIARHIQNGALVVQRSTVPVGTSRQFFLPILQKTGKQFHFACCPERTCEGVALRELRELPQIIGCDDAASHEKAAAIFQKVTPTLVKAPSMESAEILKLVDNCWRDTTFAFANEIALFCESLGLNACDVIQMANLGYERNSIPRPGFVGGPCLTKDPYLLAKPYGKPEATLPLTQNARQVNRQLPQQVARRVAMFLEKHGKSPEKAKIFVSGLAFKGEPATDDLRNSPSLEVLQHLRQLGVGVIKAHDFVVAPEEIVKLDILATTLEEGFQNADVVMILNNHRQYTQLPIHSLIKTTNNPLFFFDAWHLFSKKMVEETGKIIYGGIGF